MMSNRYVWARNNINEDIEDYGGGTTSGHIHNQNLGYSDNPQAFFWDWSRDPIVATEVSGYNRMQTTNVTLEQEGDSVTIPAGMLCNLLARYVYQTTEDVVVTLKTIISNQDYALQIQGGNKRVALRRTKGSPAGTVSNSASSTYPPRDYSSKSARIWPYSAPGT